MQRRIRAKRQARWGALFLATSLILVLA